MARHKKSELDAILEQLKQSYATDADMDLEDSLLQSEKSEEDVELASALEKIFSSNPVQDAMSISDDENVEADADENSVLGSELHTTIDIEEEKTTDIANTEKTSSVEEIIGEKYVQPDLSDEEAAVEDVLSMMLNLFPKDNKDFEEVDEISNSDVPPALVSIIENSIEVPHVSDTVDNIEEKADATELGDQKEIEIIQTKQQFDISPVLEEPVSDTIEPTLEVSIDQPDDRNVIFEIDESMYDEAEYSASVDEFFAEEPEIKMVLSPDEYTYDELQIGLNELEMFKPKDDIVITNTIRRTDGITDTIEEEKTIHETDDSKSSEAFVDDVSDTDISLMLKLGYQSEISSEVGADKTNNVILNKNEEFVPEPHKIVHGFNGKEFSNKTQIQGIKKKYKRDFISLFAIAVMVSLFATIAVILDISVVFSDNLTDFTGIIMIELMMALVIAFITWKRLLSGIIGIVKFDTNTYSIAAMLLLEFIIYSIVLSFVYALSPSALSDAIKASFGGYVFIFIALTVLGELFDCSRESASFDMMVGEKSHYVTQKHPKSFEIKKASLASGFFSKMSAGKMFDVSIIFMIGGLPILSIIVGCISAIIKDNFSVGATNTALVLMLSIPLTATITASLVEFINFLKLIKIKTVFLGMDGVTQHSEIGELVFHDIEALEVVSYTEINPNKNNTNTKKWLNISYNVLDALGGPLYIGLHKQRGDGESNITHEVTVNSISDNGIDLHFDSSIHVLIGDRQFMNANNIRVKTDINLTTAAKGSERSVVYFAFDGTPQVAFIISSKVKQSFSDCMSLLQSNEIKIAVKSYEPEINETFFDTNMTDGSVRVIKTVAYERYENMPMVETGIISSSLIDLCHAVVYSRKIMDDRRIAALNRKLKAAIGFVAVCLGCAFMCLTFENDFLTSMQQGISLVFYFVMFLGLIPDVVHTVKMSKRKIKDKE